MSKVSIATLTAKDLEAVVECDRLISGRSRRGFFRKRFGDMEPSSDGFIQIGAWNHGEQVGSALCGYAEDDPIGAWNHGELAGFASAHILEGEFGDGEIIAVLDTLGVQSDSRHQGIGRDLLEDIALLARARGARRMISQAHWEQLGLIRLFAASKFSIMPHLVLERSLASLEAREDDATIVVRSMNDDDFKAVTAIDRKVIGLDRSTFYKRKFSEALEQSGVRVSMVAEQDGIAVGFVMARVDYGEFGQTSPAAVLDTIGVRPGFDGHGVGAALIAQLFQNLVSLHIERVRTVVPWNGYGLLSFLERNGFQPTEALSFARELT